MANIPNTIPYHLPSDAVWFITGCSSGIGKSLATLILANPDYRLVATARNPAALRDLTDSITEAAGDDRLLTLALDVTSQRSVDAAAAAALDRFGRLDVLVNNAGCGLFGDAEAATREQERGQLETNFWGPVALTKHAVRIMRDENPRGGRGPVGGVVLNVTSFAGFVGFPGNVFYHASKFALEGFTEAIAKEVRPEWNIHFCLIEPGGVKTQFASSSLSGGRHPAYAAPDSPGRMIEAYMADPASRESWAEPEAVAHAMLRVVEEAGSGGRRGRIPIRLPLGADSWGVVKAKVDAVAADLDEFRELSLSTEKKKEEEAAA